MSKQAAVLRMADCRAWTFMPDPIARNVRESQPCFLRRDVLARPETCCRDVFTARGPCHEKRQVATRINYL